MLDQKTGLITTLNLIQTPTMKPTGQLMLAYGIRLASKPTANFAKPMAQGFPSSGFPLFIFTFSILLSIISPHYECCRKGIDPLIPGYGQTIPRSVSRTRQHHLNVAPLINNLGIVYHQYCSSSGGASTAWPLSRS